MTRKQLIDAMLELEDNERLELAGILLETVPDSSETWDLDNPAFLEELDRRSLDGSTPIPWSQVRAELTIA